MIKILEKPIIKSLDEIRGDCINSKYLVGVKDITSTDATLIAVSDNPNDYDDLCSLMCRYDDEDSSLHYFIGGDYQESINIQYFGG